MATFRIVSLLFLMKTAAGLLPTLSFLERLALKAVLDVTKVFQSKTVHEMIWGYEDFLTDQAYNQKLFPYPEFGIFVHVSMTHSLGWLWASCDRHVTDPGVSLVDRRVTTTFSLDGVKFLTLYHTIGHLCHLQCHLALNFVNRCLTTRAQITDGLRLWNVFVYLSPDVNTEKPFHVYIWFD